MTQTIRNEETLKETFQALFKQKTTWIAQPQTIKITETLNAALPNVKTKSPDMLSFQQKQHTPPMLLARPNLNIVFHPSSHTTIALHLNQSTLPIHPLPPEIKLQSPLPQKHPQWPVELAQLMPPNIEKIQSPMIAYPSRSFEAQQILDQSIVRRAPLTAPIPPLPSFPSLNDLETTAYSDFFDIDLVCLPKQNENGYLFAITIIPREDLQMPKLHQHYNFLIDRANCIQKDRLQVTKNAVLKSLHELSSDDTFNIFVFDNKVEKLFSGSRPADAISIAQAKSFLDQINLGSFFAPADLYNPLLLTLPEQIQDDELYTVVLLSDGENFAKKNSLRSVLQNWTRQNNGKVSLFTVSMNNDHQIANLEVACALNKGRLYTATTKTGLKRQMLKLMNHIQTPIAKNISCHAINKSNDRTIELYPSAQERPNLYLGQPLVILGSSDSLDDFVLFIQGRLKDRWINIKKTISFVNAKKGSSTLKQEWAHHQANRCYQDYASDANPSHLAEAHEWIKPFDIQPAFQ